MNTRFCHRRTTVLEEPDDMNMIRNFSHPENEIDFCVNLMVGHVRIRIPLSKAGSSPVFVIHTDESLTGSGIRCDMKHAAVA